MKLILLLLLSTLLSSCVDDCERSKTEVSHYETITTPDGSVTITEPIMRCVN